ncbi:intraflagellar transport protein 140 homolog [Thrips palmi]|uniref:Intraflagellar transport protein 140 homolog n=1 Tax=Thrips palmi TaxID=161013 RepID=A0A6P9A955_THRPL|nr:intraflagellar transport protein 140 homolog [Thrips palmi]
MTLYLDYRVQSPDPSAINVSIEWHLQHHLLAVTSCSEERGGFVTVYDELGEPLRNIRFPQHPASQITSSAWHPDRKVLVCGWENGDLQLWNGGTDFITVSSPHRGIAITILLWSHRGGRLVSADANGGLVGWRLDGHDQLQLVFQQTLREPLTHIVFKQREPKAPQMDISGLARAAVAGDEKALDMFSAWRPRTAGNRFSLNSQGQDSLSFYVASLRGLIYYVSESGSCSEVLNTDGQIVRKLLYLRLKDHLIVVTESLTVTQFQTDSEGMLSELSKVKLSAQAGDTQILWAGPSCLAITIGDLSIRLWDLESSDSYLLVPSQEESPKSPTRQAFICLAFCSVREILCAGTNSGYIYMWKKRPTGSDTSEGADSWEPLPPSNVRNAVKQLQWGPGAGELAVNCITNVYILREQVLAACYNQQVSAVQISGTALVVSIGTNYPPLDLHTEIQIKGVVVSSDHIAAWSGRTVIVYQLLLGESVSISVEGTFACMVETAVLLDKSIVILGEGEGNTSGSNPNITVRTFQGTVKQTLALNDQEGKPLSMELNGNFLTVTSDIGFIKMWDFSRREAKVHGQSKDIAEALPDFGEIILARSNCTGNKVSFTIAQSNLLPEPKLYVWDIESDSICYLNFTNGKLSSEEIESSTDPAGETADNDFSQRRGLVGRFVLSHCWDQEEPKLLVCEAKRHPQAASQSTKEKPSLWTRRASSSIMTMPACNDTSATTKRLAAIQEAEVVVTTLLSSPEHDVLIQDVFPLAEYHSGLLGLHVPYYILLRKTQDWKVQAPVERALLRDFEGLADCDKATREAIISFSYHLSLGNMDEAFKVIKSMQNTVVWESLARMCVKTKRLDVAAVCLGHMKHARGARALRLAASEPQLEARVAVLAVQLGLLDEAESLYRSCGRFDLLNQMYQASDQWDKALATAEESDRIHLRGTYHNYAGVLEQRGDSSGAAHMYHRADTHRHQVPRMLQQDPAALQQYTLKSKDPTLVKWWAQYLESTGQMDVALKCYEEAADHLSMVRVLCFQEAYDKAAQVASDSSNRAACYHLARQYEAIDEIQLAVQFFTRAQAYANAIRICKEHSLDEQLWNLSLLAYPRDQLEAARYFETCEPPAHDKAVLLYHRSGMLHKALDLAFRTQQFDALQLIAVDLTSSSDPALIQKCARFFVENNQFDKAVDLLAVGKMYSEALALCVEHNITMTEELAECLSPEKGERSDEERTAILEQLADCCQIQGNYHLATKKFTQAGNKVRAMKALLKSGDTEKIIFFANVSRQREIYVMAANYLQSLDWQNEPALLKHIVNFYTKGKALDLLANFYTACAQVEVDEYQNYEKALGALAEASRCLAKAGSVKEGIVEAVNLRSALVKKFLDVKRMFERGETDVAVSQCRQLLHNAPDLEVAVRRGDVYCLLVAHAAKQRDWTSAASLIEEMKREAGDNLAYYLPAELLELLASNGVSVGSKTTEPIIESPDDAEEIIETVGDVDTE